jgi:tripartite-type tricarboxylate transporter receptor subunit TctC
MVRSGEARDISIGISIVERRNFLKFAAAAMLPFGRQSAMALDYPSRPVQVIVGQAAASSSDITARLISQYLSQHLGQQFLVEVRPGATGNIATELVARATADGYMLLLVNSQNTINAALFPKLPFDFLRDIAPIAGVFRVPLIMEVLPSFPAQTVPEFIAYAKANPGKINMASAGVGGPQHVAGELFKSMTGVDLVHVPYHGSTPAITDLLAGEVQVMFDVTPTALPQIRAGKLRALAVTTPERFGVLPNVPVMAEFLPGYEAFGWIGFGAPAKTPAQVIDLLNKSINEAIADPAIKARLLDLGGLVMPPNSSADFANFIATDTQRWIKVVKFANLKPE